MNIYERDSRADWLFGDISAFGETKHFRYKVSVPAVSWPIEHYVCAGKEHSPQCSGTEVLSILGEAELLVGVRLDKSQYLILDKTPKNVTWTFRTRVESRSNCR